MLGQINQPFFSVSGRIIRVDGAEIQVFDYPSTGARANDSILITPTGRQIGETIPTWIGQPNFWAKDQLIVLYVGDKRDTIDLLTQVLGQPITVHTQTPAPAPPQAAVEARALLSERLNVPEEQIDLVSAERVEWPSSCLGLVEGPDPICVERVIPGWNLMFRVNGQVVEVHTDQRGDNIRIKEDTLP